MGAKGSTIKHEQKTTETKSETEDVNTGCCFQIQKASMKVKSAFSCCKTNVEITNHGDNNTITIGK